MIATVTPGNTLDVVSTIVPSIRPVAAVWP